VSVKNLAFLLALAPILLSLGCGGSGDPITVHLVDTFDPASVEGTPTQASAEPLGLWDFSTATVASDTLGWKAGPGATGLHVVDGKLVERSTTDFPLLYAPWPELLDPNDGVHALEVRIRATAGANIDASGSPKAASNFQMTVVFSWPLTSPLQAREEFHNLTILPTRVSRLSQATTLMVRPVDVTGAEFEIETIRLVSQAEHRASISSGVGWQGLTDVYHETIVSRSPETFSLEIDVPHNAWLDLHLGTVAEGAVSFQVTVTEEDGAEKLLEQTLTTPHRWEPAPVDLSAHTGRQKLTFLLNVEEERVVGFWGSPAIRTRNAMPETARTPGQALGGVAPPQGVILFMCDTLRKDHLSVYGYERRTSPNLERIAEQEAVFLDNISQATWTKVSTLSIMTSLYPTSHRVADFPDRLSSQADTLAESYRGAGFATVAYSSVLFTGKFSNLHQGFEELHEASSVDDSAYAAKTAREYVDRASDWISRHQDTPFFMFMHVFDPHDPFEPRTPYDAVWADPSKKVHYEQQLSQIRPHIKNPRTRRFGMPAKDEIESAGIDPEEFVGHDIDWYDGSILGMDSALDRLMRHLRQLGLEDKVQFVFLSDHGEEFLEHGHMFYGQTVYGELAGVPLILRRPGVIPEGVRIPATVRSIDVMPTLLDLSGLPAPEFMQGESLVPLLAAARQGGDPTI
jgi:arylsulfatase A-like enzyme